MLANMKQMLHDAQRGGYALPCFNTPNFEVLRAVVDAAEELNSPLIIGHAGAHEEVISIDVIGPVMVDYAARAKVPVCVHLDHGRSMPFVMRAIQLGFTSIMYDCSELPFEENVKNLSEFTELAHSIDLTVEAELGVMQNIMLDGGVVDRSHHTSPELAGEFVRRTGVDALAVCFGTVHGLYTDEPELDIERLREIRAATGDCKLVVHGGSGVEFSEMRGAISAGICKVNYYSYLSTCVAPKLRELLAAAQTPPYYHEIAEFSYGLMKDFARNVIVQFQNK